MRLALKKFDETKQVETKVEAVSQLYMLHINGAYPNVDTQPWREQRYWNEDVDNTFKAHYPIFEWIFKNFGGKNKKPGERDYMMADEFDTMWQYSGLVNDDFGQRDAFVNYNAAMMS